MQWWTWSIDDGIWYICNYGCSILVNFGIAVFYVFLSGFAVSESLLRPPLDRIDT